MLDRNRLPVIFVGLVLCITINTVVQGFEPPAEPYGVRAISASYGPTEGTISQEYVLPDWIDVLLSKPPQSDEKQVASIDDPDALQKELESEIISPEKPRQSNVANASFSIIKEIPPLYKSPKLEGEGVWTAQDTPTGSDGKPLAYKTVYRPSVDFPTSIVYMAVFDISRMKTRLFIGQTEPGIYQISHSPEPESLSRIVAITNAMWMQQHARGAGAIFRGQVVYPMVPGMATLVVYKDDSVDVLEWTNEIPLSLVRDARQLRHLIVKDGKVVEEIFKNGKATDSEIGLGGFLVDNEGRSTMSNDYWFLANRTAFGIREDGNLVFAMGHHISTKDLAKALVLAGCKRAIHGDANIHNIVCNFYFRDSNNKIVKRDRLSPEQLQYTMKRYDQGYSKDFFAFYEK
ncbi:MAG: hypothetical protein PHS86_01670 [Syntrophaceae bacterium]|nr:hypothetical protein [Syntrophaceae bacterium]